MIFEGDGNGAPGKEVVGFSRALPRLEGEMEVIEHDDEISGRLIDIDAEGDRAKIRLREEDRIYTGIRARREIAEKMAIHLYRPVRVFGDSVWTRSAEGFWDLKEIDVVDFKLLEETSLLEVFDNIRKIEGMEWREFDDPQAAFHVLRHGPWPVVTGKGANRS